MEEEWICAICLEDNPINCHILVPCNHRFHAACLIESLRHSGPMCPLCRGLHDDHVDHNNLQENNLENNIPLDIYEIDAVPDNMVELNNAVEENIINNIYQNVDLNEVVLNGVELNDVVIQELGNYCIQIFQNENNRNYLRDNIIRIYVINNFNYFHNNQIREAIFSFIRNNCNFNDNVIDNLLNIIRFVINNNVIININNNQNVVNILFNQCIDLIQDNQPENNIYHYVLNNINLFNQDNIRDDVIDAIRNIININNDHRNLLINTIINTVNEYNHFVDNNNNNNIPHILINMLNNN